MTQIGAAVHQCNADFLTTEEAQALTVPSAAAKEIRTPAARKAALGEEEGREGEAALSPSLPKSQCLGSGEQICRRAGQMEARRGGAAPHARGPPSCPRLLQAKWGGGARRRPSRAHLSPSPPLPSLLACHAP